MLLLIGSPDIIFQLMKTCWMELSPVGKKVVLRMKVKLLVKVIWPAMVSGSKSYCAGI
jgi:hypothetical protein